MRSTSKLRLHMSHTSAFVCASQEFAHKTVLYGSTIGAAICGQSNTVKLTFDRVHKPVNGRCALKCDAPIPNPDEVPRDTEIPKRATQL